MLKDMELFNQNTNFNYWKGRLPFLLVCLTLITSSSSLTVDLHRISEILQSNSEEFAKTISTYVTLFFEERTGMGISDECSRRISITEKRLEEEMHSLLVETKEIRHRNVNITKELKSIKGELKRARQRIEEAVELELRYKKLEMERTSLVEENLRIKNTIYERNSEVEKMDELIHSVQMEMEMERRRREQEREYMRSVHEMKTLKLSTKLDYFESADVFWQKEIESILMAAHGSYETQIKIIQEGYANAMTKILQRFSEVIYNERNIQMVVTEVSKVENFVRQLKTQIEQEVRLITDERSTEEIKFGVNIYGHILEEFIKRAKATSFKTEQEAVEQKVYETEANIVPEVRPPPGQSPSTAEDEASFFIETQFDEEGNLLGTQ